MLKIVNYNVDEYEFPCLLVLGCFDALHIGHAELLKKAKLQAKINGLDLGVMVFSGGKGGKQVLTFDEKLHILEQYNVKFVLKTDFSEEFKKTKPLDFLQNIEEKLNVKAYMSGKDFRFGEGAKGKSSTLKNYAEDEDNGVWYMSVKDVSCDDKKVSTTAIKTLLESGEVVAANKLLGRNFSVTGTVTTGAGRGAKVLGFPTMNITYPVDKIEIKHGVYNVTCAVDGSEHTGIANFGPRPTFGEDSPVLEVYLNEFAQDYYGNEITVEFVDFIRETEKFDSAEALKEQLLRDIGCADGDAEPNKSAIAANETVEELAIADDVDGKEPVEDAYAEKSETVEAADEDDIDFENELEEEFIEEHEVGEAEPDCNAEETNVTDSQNGYAKTDTSPNFDDREKTEITDNSNASEEPETSDCDEQAESYTQVETASDESVGENKEDKID